MVWSISSQVASLVNGSLAHFCTFFDGRTRQTELPGYGIIRPSSFVR